MYVPTHTLACQKNWTMWMVVAIDEVIVMAILHWYPQSQILETRNKQVQMLTPLQCIKGS